jgi:hypothetical protein
MSALDENVKFDLKLFFNLRPNITFNIKIRLVSFDSIFPTLFDRSFGLKFDL